jgi:hypothetical protein
VVAGVQKANSFTGGRLAKNSADIFPTGAAQMASATVINIILKNAGGPISQVKVKRTSVFAARYYDMRIRRSAV